MKALITGHCGFLGRRFKAALDARDWDVVGVDPADGTGDALDLFRSDVTYYDLVVHCAARIGGRVGIDFSPLAVATNLALDAWLFDWATRTRPGRVVYFSSSAAYPVDLQDDYATARPLREADISTGRRNIGRPDNTYGWTKLVGEELARKAIAAGVLTHVLRPFSGYGPGQSTDYPFAAFIDRARRRADPFRVWGDGRAVRDWIHVDDIVEAVFQAVRVDDLHNSLYLGVRGPVNLCTGRGTTFDELAALVCAQAGYQPTIEHVTNAPQGVAVRVGDPTGMLLLHKPQVSLEEGIARALAA